MADALTHLLVKSSSIAQSYFWIASFPWITVTNLQKRGFPGDLLWNHSTPGSLPGLAASQAWQANSMVSVLMIFKYHHDIVSHSRQIYGVLNSNLHLLTTHKRNSCSFKPIFKFYSFYVLHELDICRCILG